MPTRNTGTRGALGAIIAFLAVGVLAISPFLLDDAGAPDPPDPRNSAPFIQDNLWLGENHDYAVWIAPDGTPWAGRRPHGESSWETVDLGAVPGNPLAAPTADDGHNVYAIAEGPDGRVHVIGNGHADPVRYVHTTGDDFSRWERGEIAGPREKTTYPRFVQRSDGELLFFRRIGGSGDGDIHLDALGPDGVWSHRGLVVDGRSAEPDENPYLNRIAYDAAADRLHLMFTWRETSDVETTNDVGYAASDDGGQTWHTVEGTPLSTPVTHDAASTIVDVPAGELVNSGGLTLDAEGRPHGAFRSRAGDGWAVLYVRWDGERWVAETIDDPPNGRPAMATDESGVVWLLGSRNRDVIGRPLSGEATEERVLGGPVPRGWTVTFDSRAMERSGVFRTLVPAGPEPAVLDLWGDPGKL